MKKSISLVYNSILAFIKDTIVFSIIKRLTRNWVITTMTLLVILLSYNQINIYYNKFLEAYEEANSKDSVQNMPEEQNLEFKKIGENLYTLTGGVGTGDCERIAPQMPQKFSLILESPGGNLAEGSCLAAHIKLRDVITVVRNTPVMDENGKVVYTPGQVGKQMGNDYLGDKTICASACGLLFLGGDKRYLIGEVYLGIHGPGTPDGAINNMNRKQLEASSFRTASNLLRLLDQLGLEDEDVKLLFIQIPNSAMYWLHPRDFAAKPGLAKLATNYVDFFGVTYTDTEAAAVN
jgi:hypothetical protein